jgi:hypothetical protein
MIDSVGGRAAIGASNGAQNNFIGPAALFAFFTAVHMGCGYVVQTLYTEIDRMFPATLKVAHTRSFEG